MEGDGPTGLVLIAIVTSRAEALVIASMLEAAGVFVDVDAEHHASVNPISVALGGHRLRVPGEDLKLASGVIREVGLPDAPIAYEGGRLAVLKFISVLLGSHVFFMVPGIILGAIPALMLFQLPLSALGIATDPRGRNEYYLASEG